MVAVGETYSLAQFGLSDMIACTAAVRRLGVAATMEEAARRIVRFLYDHLIEQATGEPACALVRLYKTHPFGELEPGLQEYLRRVPATSHIADAAPCLVLLATAGSELAWDSRHMSVRHRAFPLTSREVV